MVQAVRRIAVVIVSILVVVWALFDGGKDKKQTSRRKPIPVTTTCPSLPLRCPLEKCVVTSPMGMRYHKILKVKRLHAGADFRTGQSVPVFAMAAGVVASVGFDKNGYGKYMILKHIDTDGKPFYTLYAHLFRVLHAEETKVTRGQVIGFSGGAKGMPGAGLSTAHHLHSEIRIPIPGAHGRYAVVDPVACIGDNRMAARQ